MFDDTGALVRRNYSLNELDPGTAIYESFQQGLSDSFSFASWSDNELIKANMGEEDLHYGPFKASDPEKLKVLFGVEKKLSQEDAEQQIKAQKLPLSVPDEGYTQKALNIVMERKKNELMRKAQIEDSTGFYNGTVQFSANVAAQMLDPVNIALSFMPVMAPAKYAALLAGANNPWSKAAIRAGVGAVEGGAGALAVEPAIYQAKQREQADYDMTDSLWNVALGTIIGGGLHAGTGALADWKAKKKITVEPQGATGEMIDNASPETKESLLKTAVQMEAQGYQADVEAVAAMDPVFNPKIFVQRDPRLYFEQIKKQRESLGVLSKIKRKEYQSAVKNLINEAGKFESIKGVDVNIDSLQSAISKLGGINREAAIADGMDPAAFKKNRAFRAQGGKGFDEMAESLNQYGYTSLDGSPLTANDLVDIVVNGKDPESILSSQARRGPESDIVRELRKSGYKPDEVTKTLEKLINGEKLGNRQHKIAQDALSLIGGERAKEKQATVLNRRYGNVSKRTPDQAEKEIMDFLSTRAMSESQIDEIERLLDVMEDGIINGDEFVNSVKSLFVEMPGYENPGQPLKNTVENGFKPENMRGSDKKASDEIEVKNSIPERNEDQELEQVQAMFDEYEKMLGQEQTDLSEYDKAISNAELDASALEAALTCRLTK